MIHGACTADLAPIPRDVPITVPAAGTYTLRVQGIDYDDRQTVFERILEVVP